MNILGNAEKLTKLTDDRIRQLMAPIEDNAKKYENISSQFDPVYNEALRSIPLVKQFIRERGLIIYGGTAIDYALRLKGDSIYPDESLAVPDLDFYSPNHAEDAYDLAKILYKNNFLDVRAINAIHFSTMKVDIKNKHFVADISYVPIDIINMIPTLEYEGMKIVHPYYQYVDLHTSLSYPFNNSPNEVVFDRWAKDIKRYNKFYKYYPINSKKYNAELQYITLDTENKITKDLVFTRFASYSFIYHIFTEICELAKKEGMKIPNKPDIIKCEEFTKKSIKVLSDDMIDIIHYNPNLFKKNFPNAEIHEYEELHLIPARLTISTDKIKLNIYSCFNKLPTISKLKYDDREYVFTTAQLFLHDCMAYAIIEPKNTQKYYAFYNSMKSILEVVDDIMSYLKEKKVSQSTLDNLFEHSPFYPSVNVYGLNNISHFDEIQARQNEINLGFQITRYSLPKNWSNVSETRPTPFDYKSNKWFQQSGQEIIQFDEVKGGSDVLLDHFETCKRTLFGNGAEQTEVNELLGFKKDPDALTYDNLRALIQTEIISYPFKAFFMKDPRILFENLKAYKPLVINENFTVYCRFESSMFPMTFTPLNKNVLLITSGDDYNNIDIITDYFQEKVRLSARRKDQKITPFNDWKINCIKYIKHVAKNNKINSETLREYLFKNIKECTLFKPTVAYTIYKMFTKNDARILDISAGWGDRLIAALALPVKRYVAADPNVNLKPGHDAIIKMFNGANTCQIHYMPFQTAPINEKFNLIFTSPPYFDFEIYTDTNVPGQSFREYPFFNLWFKHFLMTSLFKAWSLLDVNGHMVIHITDTGTDRVCEVMNLSIQANFDGANYCGVIATKGSSKNILPMWVWKKQNTQNLPKINEAKKLLQYHYKHVL